MPSPRTCLCSVVVSVGTLLLLLLPCDAQKPATILQAFDRMSLRLKNTRPWHLRMTFTLYDEQGRNPVDGSFEEWWVSPGRVRTILISPQYSWTEPTKDIQPFDRDSFLIGELVDETIDPFDAASIEESDRPDFEKSLKDMHLDTAVETMGGVRIQCEESDIVRTAGYAFALCSDPGSDQVRVIREGALTTARNKIMAFQGHEIPFEQRLFYGGQLIVSGHVEVLETFDPARFKPAISKPEDSDDQNQNIDAGDPIRNPDPVYPAVARATGKKGTVVIGSLIDVKGRIETPFVVYTSDTSFSAAALEVLPSWRYQPDIEDGKATEQTTLLEFNFEP